LQAMGQEKYRNGFALTLHPETLEIPLKWKNPQIIFVNSMSDLFHEDIPFEFIQDVFDIMARASWHTFQVLTKRSERLLALNAKISWPENVWMGVTVETQDYIHRIEHVRKTDACIKFLSLEPLLDSLPNLNLKEINWVIVGGESGMGARQMKEEWVADIKNQCSLKNIPFFFKQWGGRNKKRTGRLFEGKIWNDMPHYQQHKVSLVA